MRNGVHSAKVTLFKQSPRDAETSGGTAQEVSAPMLRKRTLIIGVVALLLAAGGGAVGAQVVPADSVIDRLRADTKGGWIKIDKSPQKPGYQRVYCITLDGYPSCDWNDVRTIPGYRISKRP